ncbi:MAG: hydrolase [Bacteroidetes bacterium]|nr:hydrolase [Bacteroidota bacterium]MDA1267603.1 hydrolase [Bacteroidota bacterium]
MQTPSLNLNRQEFGNSKNKDRVLSLTEAHDLLDAWIQNDRLKVHMKQVGHLMKEYALQEGLSSLDAHKWHLAGLLHDADWDQWPEQHCQKIIEELEARAIDPEIIRAIACHGPRYFGVEPRTQMDKMLYAFDELSGLVHAYSLMRPEGYAGMEVKGVKKRLKDKTFAAQVSREDIEDAVQRAELTVEDLIAFVVAKQGFAELT